MPVNTTATTWLSTFWRFIYRSCPSDRHVRRELWVDFAEHPDAVAPERRGERTSNLALLPNIFDAIFDDAGGIKLYRSMVIPKAEPKSKDPAHWEPPEFPADDYLWPQPTDDSKKRHYADDDPYGPGTDPGYSYFEFVNNVNGSGKRKGSPNGWTTVEPGDDHKSVWHTADRGRWHRTSGEHGQDARPSTRGDYERETDKATLYELHVETGGGWLVDPYARAAREQTEVCLWCGSDLDLPRDEHGYAYREFETQRKYCSDRCVDDADNARDRRGRRGGRFPRTAHGWYVNSSEIAFDLESITVSGVGRLEIPPEGWNRHDPRNNPALFKPRPGNYRDVFTLPLHEYVMKRRSGHIRTPGGKRADLALTGTCKVHRWRDSPTPGKGIHA